MKIAQIVSTPPFAWTTGGPARVVYELSSALAKKDHAVTIVTTTMFQEDRSSDRPDREMLRKSVNGVNFQCFDNVSRILAWKYKVYFSIGLIRYLKNHIHEFDIVHLHDLISFHAVAAMIFCKKNDVPYILSPHGCINWFIDKKILNRTFYHLFGKKILDSAEKITLLHSSEMEEFSRLGVPSSRCITVPNGIDPSPFRHGSGAGTFRKMHHILPDQKVVLYLGRIHPIKGIDLLLRSFSDLPEGPGSRLVIAGRDEGYVRELKDLADQLHVADRVVFTGPLTELEKIDAYIDADLYVLPSVHEGFGITVLEAMASGTPVIVTKSCHISESIERCAVVVEYDRDALGSALRKLLTDAEARNALAAKGLDLVQKEYSWEKISRQYEGVYREGLAKSALHRQ